MKRWRPWVALMLGLVLVAWLARRIPFDLIWIRARELPGWAWAAAMLGLATTYALRAGRLHAEWAPRHGPGYRETLSVTLIHNAAINLLPMRAGEASYPWLLHKRWGVAVADAAVSLLWLRVQDAIVLGVAGLAVLPWADPGTRAAAALAAVVALASLAPRIVRCARELLLANSAGRPLLGRIADALVAGRGGWAAWGFCIANWALKLLVVGLLLTRLCGLSLGSALAGALAGELAAVLPIQAPAGIGTYEAGVWLGAGPSTELPAGEVLGAALVVHGLMLVLSWSCALALPLLRRAEDPAGVAEEKPT